MIDFAKDWDTFDCENDMIDSFDLNSLDWYDTETNDMSKNRCSEDTKVEL